MLYLLLQNLNNVTFVIIIQTKRIVALGLLLLFTAFAFRYAYFVSYLHLQKKEFRKQVLTMASAKVLALELPKTMLYKNVGGLEWKEHNKELVIKGKYHEVLSVKVEAGIAIVRYIADEAENTLFANYFSKQQSPKDSAWQIVLSLLSIQLINHSTAPGFVGGVATNIIYIEHQPKCELGCKPELLLPPRLS